MALCGDYAFGAAALEVETAARVGAPVVFVVANNEGIAGHAIQDGMFPPGAPRIASLLPAHYEKLAELVDGHAERVERPEADPAGARARARRRTAWRSCTCASTRRPRASRAASTCAEQGGPPCRCRSKVSACSTGPSGSRGPSARAMLGRPRRRGDQARGARRRRSRARPRRASAAPGSPKRPNFYFEANNRNKKSLTLDLKRPEAREIVYELAAVSDVFVQNFRKGVAGAARPRLRRAAPAQPAAHLRERDRLRARGPRQRRAVVRPARPRALGPDARGRRARHAAAADRRRHRRPDGRGDAWPTACWRRCVARERHGVGQEVDASHLGSMSFLQGLSLSCKLMMGFAFPRTFRARAPNPLWNHYRCADDKWLALGMLQPDRYWKDLCARARAPGAGRRPALRRHARAHRERRGLRRDARRDLRDAARAPSGSRSCATAATSSSPS